MDKKIFDKTYPNPFPQVGTPESIEIDPVGYNSDLEDVKDLVSSNIGKQPIIINFYGEYGTGKTTILQYLAKKFAGDWDNLTVVGTKIKWNELDDSFNIENLLKESYGEFKKNKTNGILFTLDELQHISKKGELTKAKEKFITFFRNFADNDIDGINCRDVVLCIAMHPQTKVFLKEKGHLDVEQRKNTYSISLDDLDYYSAFMIVNQYLKKEMLIINDLFDESFINSFLILLPHIRERKEGVKNLNGRTYVQMFHTLFNFLKKKNSKLGINELKEILLGNYNLKFDTIDIKLANENKYDEIKKELNLEFEPFLQEEILDKLVFNPKWHFKEDLLSIKKTNNLINLYLEHLYNRGIISKRECIIWDPSEHEDRKYIPDELKSLEKERIYLNGLKTLYFTDLTKKLSSRYDFKTVYRLNSDYLEYIYDFDLETTTSDEIIKYYKLSPGKRVKKFLDLLTEESMVQDDSGINKLNIIKESTCKKGIGYHYLECQYTIIGDIKHKLAIFFYTENYGDSNLKSYIDDVKRELNDNNNDLAIIFLCPYLNYSRPDVPLKIRNLENRLFLTQINSKNFISFLEGDMSQIKDKIIDSIKIYVKESVKKGYTLPLTGFKENIDTLFFKDIKESWRLEIEKRDGGDINPVDSDLLADGVDGQLKSIAINSLKDFVILDENSKITGPQYSKYEKNFLEIFDVNKENLINKDEIAKLTSSYFSSYSRFDLIKIVSEILKIKLLLKEENNSYKFIKPIDYINPLLISIRDLNLIDILGDNTKKSDLKRVLSRFDNIIDTLNKEMTIEDKAYSNYELKRILNKINDLKAQNTSNLNPENLSSKYNEIDSKLNISFVGVSIRNVDELDWDNYFDDIIKDLMKDLKLNKKDVDLLLFLNQIYDKLDNLQFESDVIKDLKSDITVIKNLSNMTFPEIIKILKTSREEGNFPWYYLLILNKVLDELLSKINPVQRKFKKYDEKLGEIKNFSIDNDKYEIMINKMKSVNRYDNYFSSIDEIFFSPVLIEFEEKNMQNLLHSKLNLLDEYFNFLIFEINSIKKVDKLDKILIKDTNLNLVKYAEYISNLNSYDYLKHELKLIFKKNIVLDDILKEKISILKITESELNEKEPSNIIDDLVLNGFLKRSIYIEEYYDDNIAKGDEITKYQIRD